MDFKVISSKDNSLIKLVSALQTSAKARKENELFVLEGLRICDDAFQNGIRFDKLIFSDTAFEKNSKEIEKFQNNAQECYKITDALFKKISDTASPQGILAICSVISLNKAEIDKKGKYIALENLSDPSNLGAISRTAEALGINGIIISADSCDPFNPKVLRASMGTLLRMPLFIAEDIIEFAKSNELTTYACVVDSNVQKITDISFSGGSVALIGNEANGLRDKTIQNSDFKITIPMIGKAESLNAAVAASIAMWELMR